MNESSSSEEETGQNPNLEVVQEEHNQSNFSDKDKSNHSTMADEQPVTPSPNHRRGAW